MQQRLAALGYWLGAVDGDFGPLTQQAVFALQKSAGIARDGVVGPDTERALARGVQPTATLRGDGVEIDLGRQVLVVVRGGKVVTILNTSTGNGEWYTTTYGTRAIARTPTGTFTFLRRVDGMDESSLGKLWRPIYFTDTGYAVHGSSSVPPWPASHGCARISNDAIDMVWAQGLMPVGSTIRIR
jgi:peptidoglycan hydrolase-like protein with peptidoglycan-binding domain